MRQVAQEFRLNSCELEFQWRSKLSTEIEYVSKIDERQICDQDNLSEVQLEQAIDRTVHQINSTDIPLVNQIAEVSELMIDSC
jgi:hypothetical protein